MPKIKLEDGREINISQESYGALVAAVESKPWKPKKGKHLYSPNILELSPVAFRWDNGTYVNGLLSLGMAFKTKAECQTWIDRQLAKKRIRDHAGDQGWIDWDNPDQKKYYVYCDHLVVWFRCGYEDTAQHFDVAYYQTKEHAKEAIKKHGDDYVVLF